MVMLHTAMMITHHAGVGIGALLPELCAQLADVQLGTSMALGGPNRPYPHLTDAIQKWPGGIVLNTANLCQSRVCATRVLPRNIATPVAGCGSSRPSWRGRRACNGG